MMNDFQKFAVSNGISSLKLDDYNKKLIMPQASHINPMVLEERQLNCVAIDVYSRLIYDRIIFVGSEIDEDVANIINAQLLYLNSTGEEDIKLFVNTPGGSVIDGLAIYDTMNFVTPDVATYCLGMAASMGSVILSSGARGKRFILPHGEIMLHQVSSGTRGQCSDIQIAAQHTQRLQDSLYKILSENTGKTFDEIKEDADRDHWLFAEEALPGVYGEFGLVDSVITKKK